MPGGVIAAGNASQFSDGAGACVRDERSSREKRGLKPLGIFRGFAVAGCEPDEMGIGPVFAVPQGCSSALGLKVDRHRPVGAERGVRGAGALLPRQARHPDDRLNVNGGAIAVGHPYGVTRPAPDRPRADRRQAPRREVRRRHDVHRRRHGRGRRVRSRLENPVEPEQRQAGRQQGQRGCGHQQYR